MKPVFLKKNTQTAEDSFFSIYAEVPHTYDQFHYHHEYELHYNIMNQGTRFVGDSIEPFSNHELVLLGPNIPHYWKSDLCYYRKGSLKLAKVVVIQFLRNFAGEDFFALPEMKTTALLLEKARQGIIFQGDSVRKTGKKMIELTRESGRNRLLYLISILCDLSEIKDYKLLVSSGFCQSYYKMHNEEKISDIYNFLVRNYHQEISLPEVAKHANMNPSAFCRYFRNATNKTFSEAINEIRVGIACKNLINTDLSISQIAYECGYMNVPYFNRQFKKLKNSTPLEFRMSHFPVHKSLG